MRKRLTIAVVAVLVGVLVLGLAIGGLLWWRAQPSTDLQRAASMAPSDAERLSWTDWSGIRRVFGTPLTADSSVGQLERFLDRGYERDLTSTSALVQSAPVLQERYGFSPATADWELFSQSGKGAVVMIHLPDDADFDEIGDDLARVGYTRPSSDTGVWRGGADLMNAIGPDLTPELQHVALVPDEHLVLTSDNAAYLASSVDGLDGDGASSDLTDVVDASGSPLSASVYAGDYTCSALAMSQADQNDQDVADELLADAGEVNPIKGFAMSVQTDRRVRVVMSFETDEQARTNADTRATLAAGPAPGQGGDFRDRFSVDSVTADGRLVTMSLVPKEGQYVLSDLSTGPVLFATC
ncbi:hypothetical protein ACT8ZV_22985 [Nocardioides sp. MAHUQ-72]|uniref:hypothetical protein n=1 Tax=unclassified Nocardioides TaxID=2615069 RepID=UPI00361CFA81